MDWKRLEREDAHKISRGLIAVSIAAAVLGLVGVIWGVVSEDPGRVVDGALQLSTGLLLVGAGVAIRRRGRSKP